MTLQLSKEGVFYTLQGEGMYAGHPTSFIRLQGCNLRCTYCDTKHAQSATDINTKTIEEIVTSILPSCEHVCITGGEPLLQEEELRFLIQKLYPIHTITIETNGTIPPPEWSIKYPKILWSVDIKCPSSNFNGAFEQQWWALSTQLKFVVGNEIDFNYVRYVNNALGKKSCVISPIISKKIDQIWLQRVAEFCKTDNHILSLQLHKIIWGSGVLGV